MKLFYKGHYPFVRFLVAFLIGIGLASHFPCSGKMLSWLRIACLSNMAIFCLLCCCVGLRVRRWYPIYGLLFLTLLLLAGWVKYSETDPKSDPKHFSRMKADKLLGYVADEPVLSGNQLRFPLQIIIASNSGENSHATGKLLITLKMGKVQSDPILRYGSELMIPAAFNEVAPPYNPGEMDYKAFLQHQHIWHQAYFEQSQVRMTKRRHGNWLVTRALYCREKLLDKLNRFMKDPEARAMTAALLLGYRTNMDRDLQNAYAATGTVHILSVSGMHVAVIFWLIMKLLGWMTPRLKWLRYGLLICSIWGFTILTGMAPSALRAAIMLSFVITASQLNRQAQVYNSIAASAFMLLWADPGYAFDIGFQLSYLAVWGIIYFYPKIKQMYQPSWYGWKGLWDYTALSVAAQLGTFPLAMHYFHQFPLYFLPANLLIALPVTSIMWLGIGLLACPLARLNLLLGILLEKIIAFTNRVVYVIEGLPHASLQGFWLDIWQYAAIYLLLLALFTGIHWHSQKSYILSLGLLCILSLASAASNIAGWKQREICIYNLRNNFAIGLYSSQTSLVYSNIPSLNDRRIQYSVWPESSRFCSSEHLGYVREYESYRKGSLFIRDQLIQFADKRLMVYNGNRRLGFRGHIILDILLLRNNPQPPLKAITQQLHCRQLLADVSNSPSTIRRLQREANALNIPFYLLKDNFAYVWRF